MIYLFDSGKFDEYLLTPTSLADELWYLDINAVVVIRLLCLGRATMRERERFIVRPAGKKWQRLPEKEIQ